MDLCPQLRRLLREHARALAAAAELRGAAGGGGAIEAAAGRFLAGFDGSFLPHCRREEEVLLPELAGKLSEADALVVFALGDHCALRRLARALREELERADPAGRSSARLRELSLELCGKLEEHLAFEERTLYPALEATLGRARLAALGCELGPAEAR